jgi:propanol-preferring alcohol dehydrogenase
VPQALRALRKGGTVASAGIYMTPIPEMDYEECLFHEKDLRSVESNTREDGRGLFAEAAEVPVEARTTEFALEDANEALLQLKHDEIDGTAVLRVSDAEDRGA